MLDFGKSCALAQGGNCNAAGCAGALKQANLTAATCASKQVAAHEHQFREFDEATHFYEVQEGAFCVYKLLPDGRRYIVSFAMPGDLVGFGADENHNLSAEEIRESTVRPIAFRSLEQVVASYPGLATKLIHHAKQELAEAKDQLVTVARKTALEKVATFLTRLAKRSRSIRDEPGVVNLLMTRSDIADFLGLTLETVSRTLSRMKRSGIIDLPQSTWVVIRDMDELEMLAEV